MFKVKIFTVGKCKEAWLQAALQEYEKRLHSSIEWHLAKDTAQLAQWLEKESFIALTPDGALLDSPSFSRKLSTFGARVNFCIGDADGLPPELLARAQFQWSLSPLTFTHQMTRLILLEQIYRAKEIERGSQYHK